MQVRLKTSSWLSWTGNLNISFVHLSSNDNRNFFVSIFIDNFKIYRSLSHVMASITGVAKEYTDPLLGRGVLCLWTISICLLRKSMVPNLQLNCLDRWDEKAILKTRLEFYLILFPPTLAESHYCNVHFLRMFTVCGTRGSLSNVQSSLWDSCCENFVLTLAVICWSNLSNVIFSGLIILTGTTGRIHPSWSLWIW